MASALSQPPIYGESIPEVEIKNFTESPIEIQKIVPPNEFVKISVSETLIPAQRSIMARAELLPETPTGVLTGWVELHSNLASMPIIYIRVWANLTQ